MKIHNTGSRGTGHGMKTNLEESKDRDAKECKKDKSLTNRKSYKVGYAGSKKVNVICVHMCTYSHTQACACACI